MARGNRNISHFLLWRRIHWQRLLVSLIVAIAMTALWMELVGVAPLVGDLAVDRDTMWSLHPSLLSGVNEHGYRGRPIDMNQPKQGIRIAVVGDSATYGIGRFQPSTTFSGVLEQRLNAVGIPCEVANLGVPGFTIVQGIKRLRGFLVDGDFDYAVFRFAHNSSMYSVTGFTDFNRRLASQPFSSTGLLKRSRTVRLVNFVYADWESIDGVEPAHVMRVPIIQFRANVLESIRLCRAQGVEPIWCEYAVLNRSETLDNYNEAIRGVCNQVGVQFIEFPNLIAAGSKAFLLNENHPNGLGHQIIGETISVAVREMITEHDIRFGTIPPPDGVRP